MKKVLIIVLAAVLLVTGGMFAYTYTTATATISVSTPESDFAAVATENQTGPAVLGKYTGTWSTQNLFSITPAENYTGDLAIRVYIVNTGALIRCYEHLNMTLKYVDADNTTVRDEQGIIQTLTLQNSVVLFTWANATGTSPYHIRLTGGSYRLHPWKALLPGGSYQPQLWMEITQR